MTQRELDRAVANVTGEYVSEIRRRGFGVFDPFDGEFDFEPLDSIPQTIDWDELDRRRQAPFFSPQVRAERQAA
jgi:hypothetical protein